MLGAKIEVPTIDGPVQMSVPKGSNTGKTMRLKGRGLPGPGGARGDQYVRLVVVLPEHQDEELAAFLKAHKPGLDEDPRAKLRRETS